MVILTQQGLATSVEVSRRWWKELRIEAESVILEGHPQDDGTWVQVIATLPNEEAKALLAALNFGIMSGRKKFDVGAWAEEFEAAASE